MASRPSPVLAEGMNQPGQRVNVDIIEPAGREAHHVLLFASARLAARPHGEAEDPVPLIPVTSHGPLRGSRGCRSFLVNYATAEQPGTSAGAWRGGVGEVAVMAAILAA
jgi:hypothetical protein